MSDEPESAPSITAYKAFDADLSCRGYKYEVGQTYEHKGEVTLCGSGFHACENPFDVFNYYALGSRVCRVSLDGAVDRQADGDTKIAAGRITIEAELRMPEVIKAAVAWVIKAAKGNTATGYSGHAAATGNYGHAAATGYSGHAAATGNYGHAAATGNYGHAAATGYSGHAAATGNYGHAAATGYRGHAAATGDSGHAAATGDDGHAAVSGHDAIAASLGIEGTARAEAGGAICLAHHRWNGERYDLIAVRASLVGENGVKPGKTYRLSAAGEFEEVR